MEKMGLNIERKVNIEDFNERIESKADKQMVLNAVVNKPNKSEVEALLSGKCDS
jgi:hypothetical protein